jgi:hypothetical protein
VIALLAACGGDPGKEAWHRAFAVDSYSRADGACDAELVASEPDAPYLFVAIALGEPDSASLYWCAEPESCDPSPFANVWVTELDPERLAGDIALPASAAGPCVVQWTDLVATRDGEAVEMVYRAGSTEVLEVDASECGDVAIEEIGQECDAVVAIGGTAVE